MINLQIAHQPYNVCTCEQIKCPTHPKYPAEAAKAQIQALERDLEDPRGKDSKGLAAGAVKGLFLHA